MNTLNTKANIVNADDFYEKLLDLHQGKTKAESDAINARLILVLANHIGDAAILSQAMITARSEKGQDNEN